MRAFIVFAALCFAAAGAAAQPQLSAKEAGARYGQATGAGLGCREARTAKAATEELRSRYFDGDLAEFDKQAASIVEMWRKALSCEGINEINSCRLMKERNCRDALNEVGPDGTAYKGLLEQVEAPREP